MIIGLTGGMGCGKSTAARLLAEHGYERIDADATVREEVLPSADVRDLIVGRWGEGMLAADGTINRKRLAERVFGDDAERAVLEQWVHPRVYAHWREQMGQKPAARWIIEVPLLFEQRLENWFDFIVCVASSADVQLARLSQRGVPHALAEQRISKQLPLARKIESADLVLWNDGSLPFLTEQVSHLHTVLTERALPRA